MDEMKNGDRVEVRLSGDTTWYSGVVIKARKMWVELDDNCGIADENQIMEWREATTNAAAQATDQPGSGELCKDADAQTPAPATAAPVHKSARFLVFAFDKYYPSGGWSDFRSAHNTLAEALAAVTKLDAEKQEDALTGRFDYVQIVNVNEGEIVWFREPGQGEIK